MSRNRLALGLLLVGAGIIFLLDSLNLISFSGLVWSLLFAVAGLVFLYVLFSNTRQNWWASFPGFTLLGIGAGIFVGENVRGVADSLVAFIILGGIALSFWVVYFLNREYWWAIIPGGTMLSVAALVAVEPLFGDGEGAVGIFFLGLALTFALVYLLARPQRMTWALIPAGVMGIMAIAFLLATESILRVIGPIALVLVGIYLILRGAGRKAI